MPATLFLPGEDATLASLLRGSLLPKTETSLCSCVVTDDMCEEAGVRIVADDMESILEAMQHAMRVLDEVEERLFPAVITPADPGSPSGAPSPSP
jgi:DNA-directed RNA polymerase subunit L